MNKKHITAIILMILGVLLLVGVNILFFLFSSLLSNSKGALSYLQTLLIILIETVILAMSLYYLLKESKITTLLVIPFSVMFLLLMYQFVF